MSFDRLDMPVCDSLIAPLGAKQFFAENWGKRAVYIEGPKDKFSSLYDIAGDRWLQFAAELQAAKLDGQGVQHQFDIRPEQVAEHYGRGLTICANVAGDPMLAPTLFRFAHELAMPGAPFAKIYASPDKHGFVLHLDAFHVFVCQLAGCKRWRYSSVPAVEAPILSGKIGAEGYPVWSDPRDGERIMDDEGVPIATPSPDDFEEALLSPGDCLYLPPGAWHFGVAEGRSVGLSVTPPRASVFELISKTLEDHLMERAAWRRDVFAPPSDEVVPSEVQTIFAERIADLRATLDALDPRTLHRVWRINASAHDHTPQLGQAPLTDDAMLCHAGESVRRYLVAPTLPGGPDAIHFYAGGSEWSLPIEALAFIETLAERETFSAPQARAFDPSLSQDEVQEILSELLAAGLLAHQ